jgi:hypothetical protein
MNQITRRNIINTCSCRFCFVNGTYKRLDLLPSRSGEAQAIILQYVGDKPLLNETATDMEEQTFGLRLNVKYLKSVRPRCRSLSPTATLSRVYFDSFFKF